MGYRLHLRLADVLAATSIAQAPSQELAQVERMVAELVGTKNSGTTLAVTIEDSFDDGVTWHIVVAFDVLGATGVSVKELPRQTGGLVRVNYDPAGGNWDIRVILAADSAR